jgi:hypothetical protein
MTAAILRQATVAASTLSSRIMNKLAPAGLGDRADTLRRLRQAATLARELATRLECAEMEFAAAGQATAAEATPPAAPIASGARRADHG